MKRRRRRRKLFPSSRLERKKKSFLSHSFIPELYMDTQAKINIYSFHIIYKTKKICDFSLRAESLYADGHSDELREEAVFILVNVYG